MTPRLRQHILGILLTLIASGSCITSLRAQTVVLNPDEVINGIEVNSAEQFHQRYVERTPLGRMAVEEDFKGIVAYLASDASAYVTGQNIMVDGGWTAW